MQNQPHKMPLAIDLFCGLGGWSLGLMTEGYECVGYDIETHEYGDMRYPGRLVIQDVLTLHGSQFKDAALIVASPPCQEYSYMAMPWKLAKAKAAAIRAGTKTHTMRNERKHHARIDEAVQLYCGMRTKGCFLIARAICLDVQPVHLDFIGRSVAVGNRPVRTRADDLDTFAHSDGFADWADLEMFWGGELVRPPTWSGVIIFWRDMVVAT